MSTEIVRREQQGQVVKPGYGMPVDPVTGVSVDVFPQNYGPKERSIVMAVCERYGLDPIAREVEILHGQIYITAKGINRIATQDPAFNGCTIEIIEQDWQKGWFVVKAQAWRKGCDHPIEEYADSDGSNMRGGNKFRHTVTRAKARAMRAAFAIPFVAREELADQDLPRYEVPTARPATMPTPHPTISPAPAPANPDTHPGEGWKSANRHLRAVMRDVGVSNAEASACIHWLCGATTSKELRASALTDLANALEYAPDSDALANDIEQLATLLGDAPTEETIEELRHEHCDTAWRVIALERALGGEG